VKESEANLALLRAGPTTEQVRVAELSVTQNEAAVQAIQTQLDDMTLRSPLDGLVVARSAEQGEMAIPSQTLMTIANLEEVRLTVYIPEDQMAAIKPGQGVSVRVDSYPDRTFEGRVTFISPQAEFTPRNAQTQAERANLMFAVKVTIANADHALKPGMPADAEFDEALP
jgi:RND family efflux transporter MFP subunit